jgi:adenylate cyclase
VKLVGPDVFRVIVVPVMAPLPIAWIAMEFPIDAKLARDMQKLTSSDVSFVIVTGGSPRLVATTLPPSRHAPLLAQSKRIVAEGQNGINVTFDEESYEALGVLLPDAGRLRIYAILQRSRAERIAPYLALQAALLFIAALSVAVTFAGSIRIARRITRPVSVLAQAAREIERGNYAIRVANHGTDEIGELGRAFDGMARGLEERDRVRDVLGKVASSEVVAQLLDRRIELGGQELDATVMFTDLRDFTALCEKLTPQQSLAFLNEFLTEISEVVEAHGGVVDKYVGDGVMALFGAPVTRVDDAQRAVEAALEVRDRIERLRPRLAARGMPSPEIGMGLSTSRVVAGNVGSPSRLNYTVLGDGVNLASRLEGLTKRYQVPIVVSDRTRSSVNGIVFRELDKVRVKGRSKAGRIWEPLGREGTLAPADLEALSRWHEALHLFRDRQFAYAHELFTSLVQVPGYERPAAIYLENIAAMRAHPPGAGWDASFTLFDK